MITSTFFSSSQFECVKCPKTKCIHFSSFLCYVFGIIAKWHFIRVYRMRHVSQFGLYSFWHKAKTKTQTHRQKNIYKSIRPTKLTYQCIDVHISIHKQLHISTNSSCWCRTTVIWWNTCIVEFLSSSYVICMWLERNVPDFKQWLWMEQRLRFI